LQLAQTNKLLTDDKFTTWGYIGHNRLATHGEKIDRHTHPFWVGDVILAHNGVVPQHNLLVQEAPHFDVDSEAVANAINTLGAKEALEKLQGAYALVWYNEKEKNLYFARNDDRPITYVVSKDRKYLIYASEPGMIRWIAGRNDIEINQVLALKSGVILKIPLGTTDAQLDSKFTVWTPPPKQQHHNNNGNFGRRKGWNFKDNDPLDDEAEYIRDAVLRQNTALEARKSKFLGECKLSYHQDIPFWITACYMNSPSGKPTGFQLVYGDVEENVPYMIKANNVSLTFSEGDEVLGKIVGVSFEIHGNKEQPVIWVSNIRKIENNIDEMITSPGLPTLTRSKTPLDYKEFRALTARGCNWCNKVIAFADYDKVLWTDKQEPVCPSCVKEYYEDDKEQSDKKVIQH